MLAFWEGLKGLMGRIIGSRKMIISVIALGVMIASFLAPELGDRIEKIGGYGALILLVLTANGTIELGDLVAAWGARPISIQAAIDAIRDELQTPVTVTAAPNTTTSTMTMTSTPAAALAPVEPLQPVPPAPPVIEGADG